MAAKYHDWLAANVLSEEKHVTYRILSHALKVHCNVAKQMLFDFHQKQNAREASSVHATYLIAGIRKPSTQTDGVNGNDTVMDEGSFINSSMPESEAAEAEVIRVTTITLAKEQDLDKAKSQFESISTFYIYALSPGDIADLQVLTECNKRIHSETSGEDALEAWKTYGTIRNPLAKRRATQTPVAPLPAVAAPAAKEAKPTGSTAPSSNKSSQSSSAAPPTSTTKRPPTTKRESSSLFKSFGKTAASNAKLKLNTPADGTSDDEKDGDAMEEDAPNSQEQAKQRAKAEAAAKDKAAKDAKLRAMMEAEDEAGEEKEEDEDEVMAEAWSESEPEPESAKPPASTAAAAAADSKQQQEQNVTSTDGRRRGRRRVMRKKTTTDEEGFLVTREEAAWESFSEDETPSSKPKAAAVVSNSNKTDSPAGTAKGETVAGKKGAAKKGQGSIMNFFKK